MVTQSLAQEPSRADRNVVGMQLFIASESLFFLSLIISYILYRGKSVSGPTASASLLDVPRTAVFTAILLASSVTIYLASVRLRQGDRQGSRLLLLLTLLCGVVFLVGQGTEYARLLSEELSIKRNLFGTTFYTLTGFHGLHVLIGLLAIAIVTGVALRRNRWPPERQPRHSSALESVSLYWHFVDGVWVVVFSVVYLWTLL